MSAQTTASLTAGLGELGVAPGGVLMVHTRMSALGWVVGGSEAVVRALLDALGPEGTLVAYASWAQHVYHASDWPEEHRAAYAADPPVFDPATGAIDPDYGVLPERIRTWPGAVRSRHPEASVVAVTLLHHAEAIARAPARRMATFTVREVAAGGGVVDREYTDIETSDCAFDYGRLSLDADPFEVIARAALGAGIGIRGRVGDADCHLFPAPELTGFAVAWLEARFGADGPSGTACAGAPSSPWPCP